MMNGLWAWSMEDIWPAASESTQPETHLSISLLRHHYDIARHVLPDANPNRGCCGRSDAFVTVEKHQASAETSCEVSGAASVTAVSCVSVTTATSP